MAAWFDVVHSSTEFTGENTLLFPWRPQQEGCCHSKRQGSRQGPWHSAREEHGRAWVKATGRCANVFWGMFHKSSICTASALDIAVESAFAFSPPVLLQEKKQR